MKKKMTPNRAYALIKLIDAYGERFMKDNPGRKKQLLEALEILEAIYNKPNE